MPAIPAKAVTIITGSHLRKPIEDALREFGASGFSVAGGVEGRGAHGPRPHSATFEGYSLIFTIVATATLAANILEWVERELIPEEPSIAFVADVVAVHRGHLS